MGACAGMQSWTCDTGLSVLEVGEVTTWGQGHSTASGRVMNCNGWATSGGMGCLPHQFCFPLFPSLA